MSENSFKISGPARGQAQFDCALSHCCDNFVLRLLPPKRCGIGARVLVQWSCLLSVDVSLLRVLRC